MSFKGLGKIFILLGLMISLPKAWAAIPATDPSSTMQNQAAQSNGEIVAQYQPEKVRLPQKPWKIPVATLTFRGQGVSLYYLVPIKRVHKLLPRSFTPYPGPDKIWFRVDAIQWKQITYKNQPQVKVKTFNELVYRFEIKQGDKRATYPIKYYADTAWAVLWAREYGQYPAYLLPPTDVNFSPFIHFFQFRRKQFAVAVIDAIPKQGMGAQMGDLLNRKNDAMLWQGEGLELTYLVDTNSITPVRNSFIIEAKTANRRMLLLNDPVKWKILTFEEVQNPDKVLILESVQGNWMEMAADQAKLDKATVVKPEAETNYSEEMLLDEPTPAVRKNK
jgi:hypothetical protein